MTLDSRCGEGVQKNFKTVDVYGREHDSLMPHIMHRSPGPCKNTSGSSIEIHQLFTLSAR
jgi:hypothetical protein